MDLDSLKYADLRQLAKSVGLKANIKADKLLKALKKHFEQHESSENGNNVVCSDMQPVDESRSSGSEFVSKRRGTGQNSKRKHLDDEVADADDKVEETPAPDNAEVTEEADGKSSSKRRKVSSTKDKEIPTLTDETKPETKHESGRNDAVSSRSEKAGAAKGKIPRHEGLMKKKAALKPTTPNFKKLHEAQFNKMESIDSYVQRRNKQMEVLKNSGKKVKTQTEDATKNLADRKTQTKPPLSRASLFSPGLQRKEATAGKRRVTQLAAKPALKDGAPFKPTVLSAKKVNVKFSEALQDNEHKNSLVKTPARMSPMVPFTPTPGRKSEVLAKAGADKNPASASKTSGITPFVFKGASTTPAANKRNTFDLKASLSRPLNYKPHKGKLKPFGDNQENAALNKSQTVSSHQKCYKQQRVQTREERRVQHTEDRKQKKEKMLGARRGLVLA